MNAVLILVLVALGVARQAQASGCMGQYMLDPIERRVVAKVEADQYRILSSTEEIVELEILATGELLTLKSNGRSRPSCTVKNLYKVDVRFYEGNDCVPEFFCVTGQYVFAVDPFAPEKESFSFPLVEARIENQGLLENEWLLNRVLPTWSDLSPGQPNIPAPKQCVHANYSALF